MILRRWLFDCVQYMHWWAVTWCSSDISKGFKATFISVFRDHPSASMPLPRQVSSLEVLFGAMLLVLL